MLPNVHLKEEKTMRLGEPEEMEIQPQTPTAQ